MPDLLSTRRSWRFACTLPRGRSRLRWQAGAATATAAPRPGPCAALLVPTTTDSCHVPATSTENGPASTPPFPQTVALPKPLVCGFARATRAVRRPVKRALLPSGSRSIPQFSRLWPASPRNPSGHLPNETDALPASDWVPSHGIAWYKQDLCGHFGLAKTRAHHRAQRFPGCQ